MLNIKVYADADALANDEGVELTADYVSYVAPSTYGPPALIAPNPRDKERREPRAAVGEEVFYINTGLVPAWKIVRTAD